MDIRNYLFGRTTRQLLYKSLDASALRSRVVAQNLANVDTPGYRRKEVSFEDQLQDLMKRKLAGSTTQEDHLPFGKGTDLSKVAPKVFEAADQTRRSQQRGRGPGGRQDGREPDSLQLRHQVLGLRQIHVRDRGPDVDLNRSDRSLGSVPGDA